MSLKRRIIAAGGSIALALTGVSTNVAETDLNIDANTQESSV